MRLAAHFGQWFTLACRGRHVRRWQVAPSLIYGQVKKSHRRRKLVRVSQVMRLGTKAALKAHAMRNELVEELIVEQEAQGMQDLLPAVE
jgi:hypothetical protein